MAVEEADSSDKDAGALDDVAMQTCGNGATGSKKSNSQGYADTDTAAQNCKMALAEVTKEASTTSRPDPENDTSTTNSTGTPLDVSMSDAVTAKTVAPKAETETPQEHKNLPESNRQDAKTCRGEASPREFRRGLEEDDFFPGPDSQEPFAFAGPGVSGEQV